MQQSSLLWGCARLDLLSVVFSCSPFNSYILALLLLKWHVLMTVATPSVSPGPPTAERCWWRVQRSGPSEHNGQVIAPRLIPGSRLHSLLHKGPLCYSGCARLFLINLTGCVWADRFHMFLPPLCYVCGSVRINLPVCKQIYILSVYILPPNVPWFIQKNLCWSIAVTHQNWKLGPPIASQKVW